MHVTLKAGVKSVGVHLESSVSIYIRIRSPLRKTLKLACFAKYLESVGVCAFQA